MHYLKQRKDIIIHLIFVTLLMVIEVFSMYLQTIPFSIYYFGDAATLIIFIIYACALLLTRPYSKSKYLFYIPFVVFLFEIALLVIFRYQASLFGRGNYNYLLLNPFVVQNGFYDKGTFIVSGYEFYPSFLLHLLNLLTVIGYTIVEYRHYEKYGKNIK